MSTLFEVIVYLTAAIIAVPISKHFGLGAVLGYLARRRTGEALVLGTAVMAMASLLLAYNQHNTSIVRA